MSEPPFSLSQSSPLPGKPPVASAVGRLAARGMPACSLRVRRLLAIAFTLLAAQIYGSGHRLVTNQLGNPSLYSGGVLMACLFLLIAVGIRRRLVMLPLGSVSSWMQVHIYTGLFACLVYVTHAPKIIASGAFESILSWLFLAVSASGLYGLYSARTIPKRLSALATQPRYDRIAWQREQYRLLLQQQLAELPPRDGGEVLAEFAQTALQPYFESGLPFTFRFRPTQRQRRVLLAKWNDLRRYCSPELLPIADRLAALIRKRDELDYQHGLQWRLRAWVAVHAALSVLLLIAALVHAGLALSMQGR